MQIEDAITATSQRTETRKDTIMGEMADKAKGTANKAAGAAKDAVGKATGNERLQAEGKGQKLKGEAQKASGAIKGAMGNKV